jgi:hypothetical protein
MSVNFRDLPDLPAADIVDVDTVGVRDTSAERHKKISFGDLRTALTREDAEAGRAPRARLDAPYLRRSWIDPAVSPFGQIVTIPDFMPIPDGWWPWAPAADGLQQICNWTPEALRIGNTDVRDLSVLPGRVFTDTIGATPALPGNTVAVLRDSQGRIVANQTTTAARLTFARRPASGLRNILPAETPNITSGSGWAVVRASRADAAGNATGEPATDLTATETNVNGAFVRAALVTLPAGTYTMSAVVKGTGWFLLRPGANAVFTDNAQAWFNLGTGAAGTVSLGSGASAFTGTPTSTITPVGDGAYRCTLTFTLGASVEIAPSFYLVDANAGNPVTSGATVRLEAPQLELAGAATTYQRRVSAFDITEAETRAAYYLWADGFDDFMTLATAFAPTGGYTVAAARQWLTGFPGPLTFGSVGGASNFNVAQGVSLTVDTASNVVDFAAMAGWPTALAGRVDLVRVASASSAQAWRNNTVYPGSPTITGNATPVDGLDTLFRFGGSYGSGRFYGGVMVDRAIAEHERLMATRYYAAAGGISL